VRGRHEKQLSFGPFLENYFENRTYGFIVEDWTPVGMQQIRLTYLPISMPDHDGNRITNLRSWKEQGNNATFEANNYAVDIMAAQIPATPPVMTPTGPFAFQQQRTETTMTIPADRTMTVGQNYEFEIGVFILPSALTTPGSRDSYYTDTFRYQIGIGGLTPNNMDYAAAPGPIPNARLGGDTTIAWLLDNAGQGGPLGEEYMYFDEFALNIQQENVQNFVVGRRLFHTNFVTGAHSESPAPTFAIAADANPVFTAEIGKSRPPLADDGVHELPRQQRPGPAAHGAARQHQLDGLQARRRDARRAASPISGVCQRQQHHDDLGHAGRRHDRHAEPARLHGHRHRRATPFRTRLASRAKFSEWDCSKPSTSRPCSFAPTRSIATKTGSPDDPATSRIPATGVASDGARIGWKAEKISVAAPGSGCLEPRHRRRHDA
jgi:hypothetical protein